LETTPQVFGRFELPLKLPPNGRGAMGSGVAGRGLIAMPGDDDP